MSAERHRAVSTEPGRGHRWVMVWILVPWLAACAAAKDGPPAPTQTYDGRWPVSSMTRDADCAGLVRGEFVVVDGVVSGEVTHSTKGAFTVSGWVDAHGRFKEVQAGGTAVDVMVHGRLTADKGVGTWLSRDCSGSWSARRAR